MLFSQDPEKVKAPKKRSILGMMFGLDLGNDIRPIGESISMFVRIIAGIFASAKLFPKDHPAFENPDMKLTLAEVITTAWRGLIFTKEHTFQIFLFFAVVSSLGLMALVVVIFLFSLLVSPAHADTPSNMFVPTDTTNDWGLNWLNYIFLGQPISFMSGGNNTSGLVNSCAWRQGLATGLGYYSSGILVLAGVLLLYHLMAMIAETAYHGTPMGKRASQIWAPIRLVVAIGLLVPIGSGTSSGGSGCSMAGLNTGQYIVIQMAKWGSGLATNVWATFQNNMLNSTTGSSTSLTCPTQTAVVDGRLTDSTNSTGGSPPSCVRLTPELRSFAFQMISSIACKYIYNYYVEQSMSGNTNYDVDWIRDSSNINNVIGNNNVYGLERLCGGYKTKLPDPSNPYASVYQNQLGIINASITSFTSDVMNNYLYIIQHTTQSDQQTQLKTPDQFYADVLAMQNNLINTTTSTIQSADSNYDTLYANNYKSSSLFSGGWLAAGAWFNDIARKQAMRQDSISSLPTIITPDIYAHVYGEKQGWFSRLWGNITSDNKTYSDIREPEIAAEKALEDFNRWLYGAKSAQLISNINAADANAASAFPVASDGASWPDYAFGLIDTLGSWTGLWTSNSLGIQFNTTSEPFSEVVAYGQRALKSGFNMFAWAFGLKSVGPLAILGILMIPGLNLFAAAMAVAGGDVISAVASVLEFLSIVYIGFGLLLAFWLPLTPFIRFFFASMTWIIGVCEAVVAVPLFALAHINPEGEGLPGSQARAGYYFILNVFLRPVLMIFGLIIGYLLFVVSVSFLNTMFIVAAKGASLAGGGNFPSLAKIVYSIVYCALVYGLANSCFKAVGMFPQHALRWLGQSGHHEGMGDHQMLKSAATFLGAQALSKGISGATNMGAKYGNQALAGKHKDLKDAAPDSDASKAATREAKKLSLLESIANNSVGGGPRSDGNLPDPHMGGIENAMNEETTKKLEQHSGAGEDGEGEKKGTEDQMADKDPAARIPGSQNYKPEGDSPIHQNKDAQERQDRNEESAKQFATDPDDPRKKEGGFRGRVDLNPDGTKKA
jgi:conjugal transfer/type IV secretion protein DotA/TraY